MKAPTMVVLQFEDTDDARAFVLLFNAKYKGDYAHGAKVAQFVTFKEDTGAPEEHDVAKVTAVIEEDS